MTKLARTRSARDRSMSATAQKKTNMKMNMTQAIAMALDDAMTLDPTVLVLGEDVMNVAPRMALSLRQSTRQAPMEVARKKGVPLWQDDAVREAVQDQKGPLYVATPGTTRHSWSTWGRRTSAAGR